MFRLLSALFLALGCHLLLFLAPLSQSTHLPQLTGKKGIEIHLDMQENTPPSPPAPLQPAPIIPVSATVVAKASKPAPATTISKTAAPVRIREKTQKKRFPVVTAPSAPPPKKEVPQNNHPRSKASRPATVQATPLYHKNPKPEYPSLARRRNWQGTVILSVVVAVTGKGKSIQIHRSSGHTILDKSALQSVNSWHFLPGTRGNNTIEMEVLVPVHFRLTN
jgi:periplasmic protein TonB